MIGASYYVGLEGAFEGAIDRVALYDSQVAPVDIVAERDDPDREVLRPEEVESPSTDACTPSVEDPVTVSSGNFHESVADVVVPGRGVGLSFVRSYSARRADKSGRLGYGWTDNLDMRLVSDGYLGGGAGGYRVVEENGSSIPFARTGASAWSAPSHVRGTLTVGTIADTVVFTRRAGLSYTFYRETYGTVALRGRLRSITDPAGNETLLGYDTGGFLDTVTDEAGRVMDVSWSGGHIDSVSDPTGATVSFGYVNDELRTITDARGQQTQLTYDASTKSGFHLLETVTDPRGNVVTENHFDSQGRVDWQRDGVTYGTSDEAQFAYSGDQTTVTSPEGNVDVYEFAYGGVCVKKTLGSGSSTPVVHTYEVDPQLLATTKHWVADGAATPTWPASSPGSAVLQGEYAYDGDGNVTSVKDAGGFETTFGTYNASRLPASVTDPEGTTTTMSYDSTYPWRLESTSTPIVFDGVQSGTQVRDPGYDTTHPEDATTFEDANGHVWSFEYDTGTGQVTKTTSPDPDGAGSVPASVSTTTYDLLGRPVASVDPEGNANSGAAAADHRPAVLVDQTGLALAGFDALAKPVADGFDRAASSTTLGAAPTTQSWTAANGTWGIEAGAAYLVSGTNGVATQAGTADGTVVASLRAAQDGLGVVFRYADASNFWSLTADVTNSRWELAKTVSGTRTVVATSSTPITCCDPTDVVSVHFGASIVVRVNGAIAMTSGDTALDANTGVGMIAAGTGAGRVDAFGFGRAEGNTTVNGFDANGNRTSVVDARGNRTTFDYDENNRLTHTHRANATTLQTQFDLDGRMTAQIDGDAETTSYAYDALDRLTSVTTPLGTVATYAYLPTGNVATLTQPAPSSTTITTTFGYDTANRLDTVDYSESAPASLPHYDIQDITYDDNGRRLSMTDGSGKACWEWDSLGRLRTHTAGGGYGQNTTCTGGEASFDYDLEANVTEIGYPGVTQPVVRHFDPLGRMDWLEDFQATPQRTSFSWDLNSNLDATDLPNGADVDYSYDANDRVTGIDHTNSGGTIASFDYTRDQLAQVDSIDTALADDGDYTYDDLNRLEGPTSASWDFSFDDADNLTRLLDGRTLHYNAGNELVEQRYIGTTTETYGYDLRGNRTSRTVTGTSTTTSYTFDQANRLEGVGGLANYRYDGDGLRTRSTIWTVPTSFVWDQASGSLPMLLSASNAAGDTHYIYGPDGLAVEQITDDGTSLTPVWFGHDQLGSTRILTDTTATKVAQYDYSPYGALTGYTGTASTRLQYAGEYTDAETGFQYLRARHYDPTTRQFLSRDPVAALTQSPYGYVHGDPMNGTDPSGLWEVPGWVVSPLAHAMGYDCYGTDCEDTVLEEQQTINILGGVVDGIGLGHGDWVVDHLPTTAGKVDWDAGETHLGSVFGSALWIPAPILGSGGASAQIVAWTGRGAVGWSAARSCASFLGGSLDAHCVAQSLIGGFGVGTSFIRGAFPSFPRSLEAYLSLGTTQASEVASLMNSLYC